jgi:hypothetical protein
MGVAVEVTLAAVGGRLTVGVDVGVNEIGARVATGAAIACRSATPSVALCDSPPCTSEWIKKSAPAPSVPMINSELSTAFAPMAPGGDANRASLDFEASSGSSTGRGGSGEPGLGSVQMCSTGWFNISYPSKQEPSHPDQRPLKLRTPRGHSHRSVVIFVETERAQGGRARNTSVF